MRVTAYNQPLLPLCFSSPLLIPSPIQRRTSILFPIHHLLLPSNSPAPNESTQPYLERAPLILSSPSCPRQNTLLPTTSVPLPVKALRPLFTLTGIPTRAPPRLLPLLLLPPLPLPRAVRGTPTRSPKLKVSSWTRRRVTSHPPERLPARVGRLVGVVPWRVVSSVRVGLRRTRMRGVRPSLWPRGRTLMG